MKTESTKSHNIWYIVLPILFISILFNICLGAYIKHYHYKGFKQVVATLGTTNILFRKKVSVNRLPSNDSTFIILTCGQSNSANSSNFLYKPHNQILNYYKGSVYIAEEPLLGINGGIGGSVWTMFADKLIDQKICKNVLLIPIGIGGTNIECWSQGACYENLEKTLKELQVKNIKLTHIFWHQGEADNGRISKADYKRRLSSIINTFRVYGQDAPFYCSIASYAPKPETVSTLGIDLEIQKAQIETIAEMEHVYAGPNTDKLNLAIDRFDGQHFSQIGLERYSDLLIRCILDQHKYMADGK